MRRLTIGLIGLVCIGVTGLALANPAQLPTHPRHPSRGEFAYDRGQQTLTAAQALRDAAESENSNIVQQLEDPRNPTLLRQERAGRLLIVQGPNTKAEPPVTEATVVPKR